jgi:hypothetical protein
MALNPFSKSPDYSFASSAFGFELSKKNTLPFNGNSKAASRSS